MVSRWLHNKMATQLAVKELSHNVRKSTVQSIHNAYRKHLASARLEPQDVVELPTKQHGAGCPLYFGWDLDSKVMMHFMKAVV